MHAFIPGPVFLQLSKAQLALENTDESANVQSQIQTLIMLNKNDVGHLAESQLVQSLVLATLHTFFQRLLFNTLTDLKAMGSISAMRQCGQKIFCRFVSPESRNTSFFRMPMSLPLKSMT